MGQKMLLDVQGITKEFKHKKVLKDINIQIKEGEILGFLGPSGAGKTTTIKIITGQLKPTNGKAELLGRDSTQLDESIYEKIGIVTDNSGVYEDYTVYDNMKLYAKLLDVNLSKIDELLGKVGLTAQSNQLAGKLSKGQAQRLVLARAILHSPQMLFLDEPTSGLDPSTALDIHQLLMDLRDEGMGIFLTTHNMEEATKLCDTVALLNDGIIVEFGTPESICLRYNLDKKYNILLDNGEKVTLNHSAKAGTQIEEWITANKIESIHSCEPTLESVFLTVTGRELQ